MKSSRLLTVISVFMVLLLSTGCVDSLGKQDAEAKNLNIEKWKLDVQLLKLDTEADEIIFTTYCYPDDIEWTPDSKHFAIIENIINHRGEIINRRVRVFETETNKETKLPQELYDKKMKGKSIAWANNDRLIIGKHSINEDQYFIYNIKDSKLESITEEERLSYLSSVSPNEDQLLARYNIAFKEERKKELTEKIGTEYEEGIITLDSSKFIYCTKDKSVGLLDINTGKITHLFDGVDLVLSTGETKIAYTIPKGKSLTEFSRYGTYESTDMETWVYDLNKGTSVKVADFYAIVSFSLDDRYVIYYPERYVGQPSA